jgi:osmotically-inducible protein OsmY
VNPTSGVESFGRLNGGDVPVEGQAHFELEADATHKWQARIDEKTKLGVMTALHWDLAVPRDRVQVSVSDGWVTLTGRVAREYEKARAEADARMIPGVAGVTNHLSCEVGN